MKWLHLTIVLFLSLGILGSAQISSANIPALGELEVSLRTQLNRLLYAEQYVLDVQTRLLQMPPERQDGLAQNPQSHLPGLWGMDGRPSGEFMDSSGKLVRVRDPNGIGERYGVDVLVVFDRGVRKDRREVAEQLIRRTLASRYAPETFSVQIARGDILRVMPEELRESLRPLAPLRMDPPGGADARLGGDSWDDTNEPTLEPNAAQTPAAEATPTEKNAAKSESTNDTSSEKDKPQMRESAGASFSMRDVVFVIWGTVASLMALIPMLFKRNKDTPQQINLPPMRFPDAPAESSRPAAATAEESAADRATERRNLEKEQAIHQLRDELTKTARNNPTRVATVLTGWSNSDTNAQRARVFLQTLDMETLSLVCNAMSPADVQVIFHHNLEGYELVSEETSAALDAVRSALAIELVSGEIQRVKSNPLDFLRRLSEDELVAVLEGESEEILAMASVVVPPARLQKLFAKLSGEGMQRVMRHAAGLASLQQSVFETAEVKLRFKLDRLGESLVSRNAVTRSLLSLVAGSGQPHEQVTNAHCLMLSDPKTYDTVRERLLLPFDLNALPENAIKLLAQEVDVSDLAAALGGLDIDFSTMSHYLPATTQTIFVDDIEREQTDEARLRAWRQVRKIVTSMVESGVITNQEITLARKRGKELEAEWHAARASDNPESAESLTPEAQALAEMAEHESSEEESDKGEGGSGGVVAA